MPDQAEKKYGDFASVPDYQSAAQIYINAQNQFNSLDAHVRKRFNNNPAEFLEFASDASNVDEMVKLGLATIRQETAPVSDPKANPDSQEDPLAK